MNTPRDKNNLPSDNSAKGAAVKLLGELISYDSISPDRTELQEAIIRRLERRGFRATRMNNDGIRNVWAEYGDRGPLFVFSGHTDVVPAGEERFWTSPPFAATMRDGKMFGRGAADMKGEIAAMVVAIEDFLDSSHGDLSFRLGVMLAGDEEADLNQGTEQMLQFLESSGKRIDAAIVGEPSSLERLGDQVKIGRRGSLTGKLTVFGRQGHVAYPERFENPLHRALPLLTELRELSWPRQDQRFPSTRLQITNCHCGTGATNVVPATCKVIFNIRYAPEHSVNTLQTQCEKVFRRHDCSYEIEWIEGAKPYLTSNGSLLQAMSKLVSDLTGRAPELSTAGGTSDARFFAELGIPVVELGLVGKSIHQADECVPIEDLNALTTLYLEFLRRFPALQF